MVAAEDAACMHTPDTQLLRLEALSQAEVDREAAEEGAGAGKELGKEAGGAATQSGEIGGRGRSLGVELESRVRAHNYALDRLLDSFGGATDQWRTEIRDAAAVAAAVTASKRQRF
jgi:predicted transposase YdaD